MSESPAVRPVARSMRAFLYVAIALTFFAGTELSLLSEHTGTYFAWQIEPPLTAAFMGACFWAACVVLVWASRQNDWIRARLVVPSVLIVATLLLGATLRHLEVFDSLLGFAWVQVYALVPPVAVALGVIQLSVPGSDPPVGDRLSRGFRLALALEAAVLMIPGAVLFASPSTAQSFWLWDLSSLTSKTVGTWLMGIGAIALYVVLRNERADVPGASLGSIVLGGMLLIAVARFHDDVDFGRASAWCFLGVVLGTLAIGLYGTRLAWREHRFAPIRPHGGVPVESREYTAARRPL